MTSIYQCVQNARTPADIPRHDWYLLADAVMQEEPSDRPFAPGDRKVVGEHLAHLAGHAALVRQLLADRAEWIDLAYAAGCTGHQIAEALGLSPSLSGILVGGAR